jgi:sugar phosphate permease
MAGMLAQAVVSSLQQDLPALGPLLIERYGLSLSELGALLSSASWGLMLTLYLWGRVADRFGERWVVAAGLTGMGLVLCLAPFTTTALQLGSVIFLAGAMSASTIAATGRAVMGWFARSERGMALGLRQMAVPVGAAVSALVLPFVAISYGAPSAFLALAAFSVLAAVTAIAGLRPPPGQPVK